MLGTIFSIAVILFLLVVAFKVVLAFALGMLIIGFYSMGGILGWIGVIGCLIVAFILIDTFYG